MMDTPNGVCLQAPLTLNFIDGTQINATVNYIHKGPTNWIIQAQLILHFIGSSQINTVEYFHKGHKKWSMCLFALHQISKMELYRSLHDFSLLLVIQKQRNGKHSYQSKTLSFIKMHTTHLHYIQLHIEAHLSDGTQLRIISYWQTQCYMYKPTKPHSRLKPYNAPIYLKI